MTASRALLATLVVTFLLSTAHTQTETATIRGSVTDPTGAVVPRATIRLIDVDRGPQTEATTGNGGFYTFASVRPGHYRMEVEKSGFKLVRLTGITVNVQDNVEQNFRLDVGAVPDSVTVEANAVNVNTTDGTVSTVIDRTFADNLPLNGRSFQTLIMLTPGTVLTTTAFDDQGQFSVNGQRADANYFTVDGVSANFGVTGYPPLVQTAGGALPALSAAGGTNSLVSVDAMQEFRVQTSSFAPEFGRTPGGQISIVTRSGTNAFHGTAFEYFRNDVLDANDWFSNFNHRRKPEERQNDFGGVFGGPVIKDKTFFFFSYEGLRLRQPSSLETAVPCDSSCEVFGDARGTAPSTMQPYLNVYPVPNGQELFTTSGQPTGLAQFNESYSNPSSLDAYSMRIDHVINSKLNLFGRYNYSPSSLDQRAPFSSNPVLSTKETIHAAVHTFTLGLTMLIRPEISNEVRANYSNDRVGTKYGLDSFGGAVPLSDSLLFPSGLSSTNSVFEFVILGSGEFAKGKFGSSEQRQVNFVDNLSLTKGSHQLKVGVDYRWLSPFASPFNYAQFAEFVGVNSNPGGALSGIAAFTQVAAERGGALLSRNLSLYGQDTWKITPRLTVTYGLRWDVNPALKGKNSDNEPFTVTGLNNPPTIALAPRGTPLYGTTYGNVAPRVGLAYQLGAESNWGAVLRGGFGIFYDLGSGSLGGASSYFPFGRFINRAGVAFPLSTGNAAPPVISTDPPVSNIVVADHNLKLPRTYQWNAALEQSLGSSQSFSLTYVGAVGRDQLRVTNIFNPNTNFGQVSLTTNSATSDYHALQVKFERRLSQGLQTLASYTWSHSIDIASTDAFAHYLSTPPSVGNPNIDRANSDFDIRHSFTAGVTYNLPTPGSHSAVSAVLGGWSVDSFVLARSAPPVDVVGGFSFAAGTILKYRPNVNPGVPLELSGSQYPGGKIFNQAAFTPAAAGQQGDFGRNVLRGFNGIQADVSVQRQFRLTENVSLRFRSEFFNIFNHPNFGPPNNTVPTPTAPNPLFGYSTQTLASSLGSGGASGGLNPLYQMGGPRSIQLALKLQF
jgi:hypothetical protein